MNNDQFEILTKTIAEGFTVLAIATVAATLRCSPDEAFNLSEEESIQDARRIVFNTIATIQKKESR